MGTIKTVAWKPTEKQAEFIAADEEEVLFGGSAGGGKSDALLIDALGGQQSACLMPSYRALLMRKSFPELRDLIDRSEALYPLIVPGAQYYAAIKEWHCPSGAKIEFGYLERESDRFMYQGRQYQWIGIDELTQWATPVAYEYLFSRLRSPGGHLKVYMRATCNPGGVGHRWVRSRFNINDRGDPSVFVVNIDGHRKRRRFIPARLADNPYLAATDYATRLKTLPDMERRALLEGRWDVIDVPGAIYKREIEDAFSEGRIGRVPYDPVLPVHTAWDLGVGDATSIWFCQVTRAEVRLIDYFEASGEGLNFYASVLDQKRYKYGLHYAPHDIEVRELGSGRSRIETAASLGLFFNVAPNIALEDGIHAARMLLPRCWFDQEKCAAGLECLQNYRREYNSRLQEFKATPVHDFASHGADALRYLALSLGESPASARSRPLNYPRLSIA
jgi:hypothetical protein